MNHDQRSTVSAVVPCATAPVGGLSSGDRTDRPGGVRGDGAVAAPAAGPVASIAPQHAWAPWARPQLVAAIQLAAGLPRTERRAGLAAQLHRHWYAPPLPQAIEPQRSWGPLGGLYRRAHAGSGAPVRVHGISVVDRHDVLGRDGWWRTWSDRWLPTRSRADSIRVLLTPRPDSLPEFVTTLTAALKALELPWLLSCPTDVRRLRRAGAAQLHVPSESTLDAALLDRLAPLLLPTAPPLCRPLAPGVAVVQDPGHGPTFGVHRCRLVAVGLNRPDARRDPLTAIARAFAHHGIDPAAPHRTPR